MKVVKLTDERGFLKWFLIRDQDADDLAKKIGMPVGPPSFARLDIEAMAIQIEQMLAERGIHDWNDVQRTQNSVTNVVSAVVRKHVTALYRQNE